MLQLFSNYSPPENSHVLLKNSGWKAILGLHIVGIYIYIDSIEKHTCMYI